MNSVSLVQKFLFKFTISSNSNGSKVQLEITALTNQTIITHLISFCVLQVYVLLSMVLLATLVNSVPTTNLNPVNSESESASAPAPAQSNNAAPPALANPAPAPAPNAAPLPPAAGSDLDRAEFLFYGGGLGYGYGYPYYGGYYGYRYPYYGNYGYFYG